MAQVSLYCLDVIPCTNGSYGKTMSYVMEARGRKANGCNYSFVVLVNRVVTEMFAAFV